MILYLLLYRICSITWKNSLSLDTNYNNLKLFHFQHDGVTPAYVTVVRNYVDVVFTGGKVIGRQGTIERPPRSPRPKDWGGGGGYLNKVYARKKLRFESIYWKCFDNEHNFY